MRLSIVIPTLNEAATIKETLLPLQSLRRSGHQLLLADGGSEDATLSLSQPLVDHIVSSAPGRARQMNAGARVANGDILLFLHADTRLPEEAVEQLQHSWQQQRHWGRFDVRLSGHAWLLRVVERLMNWRSCLSGVATGDQAIFVERQLFEGCGGYAEIALMEDIELSKRLRRYARPVCLHTPVLTSSRRWEHYGIVRTILLMWRLRLAYFFGADPAYLARRYRQSDS